MYPQHKYLFFLELSVRVSAEDGGQGLLLGFLRLLCLHQFSKLLFGGGHFIHTALLSLRTEIVLPQDFDLLSSELLKRHPHY